MTFKYQDADLDLAVTVAYLPAGTTVDPAEYYEHVDRKLIELIGSTGIYFVTSEHQAEWLAEQLGAEVLQRDPPPEPFTDPLLVY
jgi:hypothetical protein